jgi:hypothetical protein
MRLLTLVIAVLFFLPVASSAQSRDTLTTRQMMQYKDPGTATLISVLMPGAGHLYASETGRGLGVMAVSAGSIGAGYYFSSCPGAPDSCGQTPLYIGIGLHFANWIWSIVDAGDAARRHNRRLFSEDIRVRPIASVHGTIPAGGLQLTMHF